MGTKNFWLEKVKAEEKPQVAEVERKCGCCSKNEFRGKFQKASGKHRGRIYSREVFEAAAAVEQLEA